MSIKQAIEALESCDPGDYSTGHVIHPSYDEEKVNAALAALRSMPQGEPVPVGWHLVPNWKGYALLGTGRYLINHSAEFDPELGAELFITLATDEDRAGDRQIGESRDTREPGKPVQPEDMVLRIGFLSERALFALEDQLRIIRETHFAATQHTEAVRMSEAEIDAITKAQWGEQIGAMYAAYRAYARAVEQATAARLGVKMGDV